MSYESAKNIFKLMKLLSGDKSYSIVEIEDVLGIDERTFFRYQKAMVELKYVLSCQDGKYIQNKKISSFTLTELSKQSIGRNLHFNKDSSIDIVKVYNTLFETQATEVPNDFISEFLKDFQEFYLN